MKEVIDDIERWLAAGDSSIALATVVDTWGSAPRKVGAKMAFTTGGAAIAASVSGGCVEGVVITAGDEVLATGRPQLLHFGVDDELAWGVGLACGGTIDVFVECLDINAYRSAQDWIARRVQGMIVTVISGPDSLLGRKLLIGEDGLPAGELGHGLDAAVLEHVGSTRHTTRQRLSPDVEVFIDVLKPSPTLVIVGGAHIAVALAQLAKLMGYRTVVIDPRRAFGSEARFPNADWLLRAFPDKAFAEIPPNSETAIVTLSHDPKIDDPALRIALNSDAFYVGALGSRKTNAKRRERLTAMGFTEADLAHIHAPVGLDIGADNPEEIALAIMGEVVATYRGRKDRR